MVARNSEYKTDYIVESNLIRSICDDTSTVPEEEKEEEITYYASANQTDAVEMQTRLAVRAFLHEFAKNPNIIDTKVLEDCRTFKQTVHLTVPDLFDPSVTEIFKVRTSILHKFPDALVEIDIDDLLDN